MLISTGINPGRLNHQTKNAGKDENCTVCQVVGLKATDILLKNAVKDALHD
uniref:Uncharacterized protein n=1 Tax=Rhizophora mucronata TaxID=61149 RepID=A0A2P2QL39_RHIMU